MPGKSSRVNSSENLNELSDSNPQSSHSSFGSRARSQTRGRRDARGDVTNQGRKVSDQPEEMLSVF